MRKSSSTYGIHYYNSEVIKFNILHCFKTQVEYISTDYSVLT